MEELIGLMDFSVGSAEERGEIPDFIRKVLKKT